MLLPLPKTSGESKSTSKCLFCGCIVKRVMFFKSRTVPKVKGKAEKQTRERSRVQHQQGMHLVALISGTLTSHPRCCTTSLQFSSCELCELCGSRRNSKHAFCFGGIEHFVENIILGASLRGPRTGKSDNWQAIRSTSKS